MSMWEEWALTRKFGCLCLLLGVLVLIPGSAARFIPPAVLFIVESLLPMREK